jgi:hypothetical protein
MEIGPAYPLARLKPYGGERRQKTDRSTNEPPSARPVGPGEPSPQAIAVNDMEGKTRRVAELIRERRENRYYHRTDVLREVVSRLLESKDLDIARIKRD